MKLYSELFCTYSMEEKTRVIHILEEHQIPYKIIYEWKYDEESRQQGNGVRSIR